MPPLKRTRIRNSDHRDSFAIFNKGKRSKTIHNQYAGICSYCQESVEPDQGLLEIRNGQWSVIHIECAMLRGKVK